MGAFTEVEGGFIDSEKSTIVFSIFMDTTNIITEFYIMYTES